MRVPAANTPGTNTYNNYAITGMTGVYIKGVGGIYFEGNDAKFSYIEGRAQGNIVQQVEDKTRRKCKMIFRRLLSLVQK